MIVPHVNHQRLPQRQRQGRVVAGHRHGDRRRRVGDHAHDERHGVTFERRAIDGGEREPPGAAGARGERAGERRPIDAQRDDRRPRRPGGGAQQHARRAARDQGRPLGHRDRVHAGQHRLVGAIQVRREARGDFQRGEKRRQRHGDAHLGAATAAARRAQEQVVLERAQAPRRASLRAERHDFGAPRFPRAAPPQRRARRPGRDDRDRHAVPAVHRRPVNADPHGRPRVSERAQRMPERRRAPRGRSRRHEQHGAQRRDSRRRGEPTPRPLRERPPHRGSGCAHDTRGARVRRRQQVGAAARPRREQSHHAPRARAGVPLDEAAHQAVGYRPGGARRESQRHRGDRHHHDPRERHRDRGRGELHPRRRDGERRPHAGEGRRERAGARVRSAEPSQAPRRLGHRVALTA